MSGFLCPQDYSCCLCFCSLSYLCLHHCLVFCCLTFLKKMYINLMKKNNQFYKNIWLLSWPFPMPLHFFLRQFDNSLWMNERNLGSGFLPFSDCFGELSTTSIFTEEEFDDSLCGSGIGSEVISSIKGMFDCCIQKLHWRKSNIKWKVYFY